MATRAPGREGAIGKVMRVYGLIVAWVVVVVVFSVLRPNTYATFENLRIVAGSQAVLIILTIGLLVPFTVGEFDISIAGVMSISIVLIGWLNVVHGWPIGLAIAVALATGILVGLIHAFFVVVVGVDSIVVTLGSGTLLIGAGIGINNLTTGGVASSLVVSVRTELLGIPLAFYYGLVLTGLLWYVLSHTPLGRYMYFTGAGRDVARLSGVRVDLIRTGSFVASGLISALAGVVLAGWLGASDPNVSAGFLLPAFAGAFLGATAISPGRFNPWGSFVAVYFLVSGITGLELLGLSGWIEQVFYGGSLILAVAFSHLAAKRLADSVG